MCQIYVFQCLLDDCHMIVLILTSINSLPTKWTQTINKHIESVLRKETETWYVCVYICICITLCMCVYECVYINIYIYPLHSRYLSHNFHHTFQPCGILNDYHSPCLSELSNYCSSANFITISRLLEALVLHTGRCFIHKVLRSLKHFEILCKFTFTKENH